MVLPTYLLQGIRSAFYKVCKQNDSFTSCSLICPTNWIFTQEDENPTWNMSCFVYSKTYISTFTFQNVG